MSSVHLASKAFEYKGCLAPTAAGQLLLPQDIWLAASSHATGEADPFMLGTAIMCELPPTCSNTDDACSATQKCRDPSLSCIGGFCATIIKWLRRGAERAAIGRRRLRYFRRAAALGGRCRAAKQGLAASARRGYALLRGVPFFS
jgi:hypothetical protein